LTCYSCQIRGSKPPRPFGNFVEGWVVDKIGIQTLVRFSFKIWRKFILNMATLKCVGVGRAHAHDVTPGRATSASPPYRWARTPERACDRRSEAGLCEHCVPTGCDSLPTPRPVPCGHRTLAPTRAAFRH
jgi:hypothetical protein